LKQAAIWGCGLWLTLLLNTSVSGSTETYIFYVLIPTRSIPKNLAQGALDYALTKRELRNYFKRETRHCSHYCPVGILLFRKMLEANFSNVKGFIATITE
jgi:hypothetical protein